MIRNSEGKIVDENGVEVFKSDVFKKLSGPDHLVKVCPSSKYLDFQMEKAYLPNAEDARNFIQYHSSKLLDDNSSLASDKAVKDEYINDVTCFLAVVNCIDKKASQDIKNIILGGTFPTKNDNSQDSMVPMYLCTEMLKAKCLKDIDTPVNNLDNYDITENSQLPKDSTLGKEFDKNIEQLKKLDYDKSYFNADMSDDSMKYLSACQIDPSGAVDIFAKCEQDKCVLYVTQGQNINNISMFEVKKEKEVTPNIDIPAIEQPVIATPKVEEPVVNTRPETSNNDLEAKRVNAQKLSEELKELDKKIKELTALKDQKEAELHEIYDSMFKKSPLEEAQKQVELQQMVTPQVQPVAPSINAAMFR